MSEHPHHHQTVIPPKLPAFDNYIFDLDNTIYAAETGIFAEIDRRMTLWIANHFGMDALSARALQKDYYRRYGTTLSGLMIEDSINPDEFLYFVHDLDRSHLTPDYALKQALNQRSGQKFIMTNGSKFHAEETLEHLGINTCFDRIWDIKDGNYIPKPHASPYESFLEQTRITPSKTVFFEDMADNLEVPKKMGMTTVWITQDPSKNPTREEWEFENKSDTYHDYMIRNLSDIL